MSDEIRANNGPLELAGGERWYVAMTLPRKERAAAENLGVQGFRSFSPLQRATRRHARKLTTVLEPVFPRYIFVVLNLEKQRWRSVNGTFGVGRLLMSGDRPEPVAPGIVETLARSLDARGALVFQEDLSVGLRVRLRAGPFAESFGVLHRLDGEKRVQVLLDVMGGVVVSVPRQLVALAR